MFSNRFYYIKLLASLAIVLFLFVYSYKAGLKINPAYWICQLRPDEFNDYELWVPKCTLIKKDDKILIKSNKFSIPVSGYIDPGLISEDGYAPFVSVTGKFVKGNPSYIEIKDIKKLPLIVGGRRLVEGISLVVLLYVALIFFRVFDIKHKFIFE